MTTSVGRVTADAQSPTLARGHNDLVDAILGQNGKSLPGLTLANADAAVSTVLDIRVGGASAADPFVRFAVDGVTTWSAGIDNSDSDAWVLAASGALGTTNVLRALSTGITLSGTLGVTGVSTLAGVTFQTLTATGNAAASGTIRLLNAQSINARNAANAADMNVINTNVGDGLSIGDATHITAMGINSSTSIEMLIGNVTKFKVDGNGIAFFAGTPASKQAVLGACSDLPTVIALANSIRSALLTYTLVA